MKFKYRTEEEVDVVNYYTPFLEKSSSEQLKAKGALETAWKNRDFEIDKYWSRATYFWSFIAASFAAYFLVSKGDEEASKFHLLLHLWA
jgi:hypothetical protein